MDFKMDGWIRGLTAKILPKIFDKYKTAFGQIIT